MEHLEVPVNKKAFKNPRAVPLVITRAGTPPSRGSDLPPAFGRRAIRRAFGLPYVHLVTEVGPKETISATGLWETRSPGLKQTHGANNSVQILLQLKTLARTTSYQVSSLKGSRVEAYWLVLHYVQHDRPSLVVNI
ncbi:hypothetical protein Bbelb_352600 [Branchiostoma belcheri]|nr:hypothetical protein Bbelb_352600 [Branchiostoma belcheri]